MAKPKGQVGPPAKAIVSVPEKPYVDPIKAMYETAEFTAETLDIRGKFSCEVYCHLIAAHKQKALQDPETPQLTLDKMRILAKEAVFSADVLLQELAASHNRRI